MTTPDSTRHRDALATLLALTDTLAQTQALEDALRAVTDAALVLVAADHASIRLLDATHTELLSGARSGTGTDQRPVTFRRGQGIIGWVVEYHEGVRIDDAENDTRFVRGNGQGFTIRSMIAEPLMSAGHVMGVLSVSSPKPMTFAPDDHLLVRLLANCCTPPIERARLRRLALTDDLTLAYNQRYFSPRINEEMERARRSNQQLSLMLLDLDHFKLVNDELGHDVGDAVLRAFADRVRSLVRRIDVFVRRGGEEFLLVMPQTSTEQAKMTADRIRDSLTERPLELGGDATRLQTVSIGIATWDSTETPELLQRRADMAMYEAKQQGRNRSVVSDPKRISMQPTTLRGR